MDYICTRCIFTVIFIPPITTITSHGSRADDQVTYISQRGRSDLRPGRRPVSFVSSYVGKSLRTHDYVPTHGCGRCANTSRASTPPKRRRPQARTSIRPSTFAIHQRGVACRWRRAGDYIRKIRVGDGITRASPMVTGPRSASQWTPVNQGFPLPEDTSRWMIDASTVSFLLSSPR